MTFKENGYEVIREFIDKDFVKFIQEYFFLRIKAGHAQLGDDPSPTSYCFYGDPLIETILQTSINGLQDVIGYKLLPTYSYTRLYGKGDELKNHRDRSSCEISGTLALGFPDNDEINSIFFSQCQDKLNPIEIKLNPGDLCLYRGCDLWHWREPFKQNWYLQAFLHYVDADGPYTDRIYDSRPYLGMQPID